jgi:predicted secreted protein
MNKYVLIGVGVVAIVTIIFASKILIKKVDNSSKQLELTYEINAGIPFKWVYEIEDESIVQFVRSYVVKDENTGGKVGASVYTNYVFKGLKKGTTTITFKYIYFDDNKVHKKRSHIINVDEDNNISEDNS